MSPEEEPDVAPAPVDREAVREKAQQVRSSQNRARWIRRGVIGAVGLAVVAAAAVGVGFAISSSVSKPLVQPSGMDQDGVLLVAGGVRAATVDSGSDADAGSDAEQTGEASGEAVEPTPAVSEAAAAPVAIHIFVDYLSPGAGAFERGNSKQLKTWTVEGAVDVTYHPVAMLTSSSNGTKYSLRAAGAAACVSTHAPEYFSAFNHALLVKQPAVDSSGFSDVELVDMARSSGVVDNVRVEECVLEQEFVPWAKEATARALQGPLPGSTNLVLTAAPTVVVNGKVYVGAMDNPAEFSQFVLSVASDSYYSATPSPSPTPSS